MTADSENDDRSPLGGLRIAAHHGVSFEADDDALSDSAFEAFRKDYLDWSQRRDAAVLRHLKATPTLFRVLLPGNARAYALAKQLAWYLDELVFRDPVAAVLTDEEFQPHDRRRLTLARLAVHASMAPAMQQGYLLQYGSPLGGRISDTPSEEVAQLVDDAIVRASLQAEVYCGRAEGAASDGSPVTIYQIALEMGGMIGIRTPGLVIPPYSTVALPAVNPNQRLPPIQYDELARLIGTDPLEEIRGAIAREVQVPLLAALAATRADAAVLFDRRAHSTIVERAGVMLSPARQRASVQTLDLALPYVANLQAEALADLRAALPDAFRDFRSQMVAVVGEATKTGVETPGELKAMVDARVLPIVRALEAEMHSAARRTRILGYGSPAVAAFGALTGGVFGLDPAIVGTAMTAGLAASLKAAADSASSRTTAAANPMYFLWRAKQSS